MALFWKKESKDTGSGVNQRQQSPSLPQQATLSDLDEPPKPLFDQHRSQMGSPNFEQKVQETLQLPKTLATPQDATTSFPFPSSSFLSSPLSSTTQGHLDDVPYNFDVLLEEVMKQGGGQQKDDVQQKDIEQPLQKKAVELKVVPVESVFLPLLNLTNAEEVIYALQEDLALSDDTLYRVDELNRLQLLDLEKWHLELDMIDTLLNRVDQLLFLQQTMN